MNRFWKSGKSLLKPFWHLPDKLRTLGPVNLQGLASKPHHAKRLTVAGGLFFTGILITHVSTTPTPLGRQSTSNAKPWNPYLWQSEGLVRQSVADLYRARRFFLGQTASNTPDGQAAAGQQASKPDGQSSSSAATSQSSSTATSSNSSSGSPVATAGGTSTSSRPNASTKQVGKPADPPKPSAQSADFDISKTIDTNLEMRVAVAKNTSAIDIATSVDGYLIDVDGQNYCNLPAQTSYTMQPRSSGMGFGDCQLSGSAWLEPGEGGLTYINGNWYKGRVLLLSEGNNLMAVNFVLLYDYLSSVVGSEMYVHWPIESLKAQAVAARSYALTHHVRYANRAYDLDNTQRYQAYLGIAKETNTTQAAVAATAGEFISHNGGIVESLYAASDEIVKAAHGGNGMSQTGAMQLASQGYSYSEILGNYYPGTSLSRLVVD
jgi:stage II sporulation protein D